MQVHSVLPGSLEYVLTCCPPCLRAGLCSTLPNPHPACRRRLAIMVEGTVPVRSQSVSPLRPRTWTSRGGLANNECSLMCELPQTFSSVHPGLEDDGERFYEFKNHTIEVANGYNYLLCLFYAELLYFLLYNLLRVLA